jgi:hypothetical protein
MTERRTNHDDQDLVALLAGDRAGTLDEDELADLTLVAELLVDPATWAEPSATLEDDVVEAVASAPDAAPARRSATRNRRRRTVFLAAAAAVAVAVPIGAVGAFGGGSRSDYRAALRGTALAPRASASAAIRRNDSGFRVTLDTHGLPALPRGEYYQAWLKNDTDDLVPIGTFSSGDGRVTLWSGVSPHDYPTMSVTIEQADNDQHSSGRRVLTGITRSH